MIVRCDAVDNYTFLSSQMMLVVGLKYGEVAKNCMSLLYSLQVQDRTTGYLQLNVMTNSEM